LGPLVFHQVRTDHVKYVLLDHAKNYPRSWYYAHQGGRRRGLGDDRRGGLAPRGGWRQPSIISGSPLWPNR
jgi:hypothetical protein